MIDALEQVRPDRRLSLAHGGRWQPSIAPLVSVQTPQVPAYNKTTVEAAAGDWAPRATPYDVERLIAPAPGLSRNSPSGRRAVRG